MESPLDRFLQVLLSSFTRFLQPSFQKVQDTLYTDIYSCRGRVIEGKEIKWKEEVIRNH